MCSWPDNGLTVVYGEEITSFRLDAALRGGSSLGSWKARSTRETTAVTKTVLSTTKHTASHFTAQDLVGLFLGDDTVLDSLLYSLFIGGLHGFTDIGGIQP